jgi:LPXTG-motif cell wall-anchored protein
MIKKALAAGTGIVFSLLSISPANAASFTVNDIEWAINAGRMVMVWDSRYDVGGPDNTGAYGLDSSRFQIYPHGVETPYEFVCEGTTITEADSDVIADCGAFSASGVAGIEWTGNVKVFAGDYLGLFARQVVSLKNTTASDIAIDYEVRFDLDECLPITLTLGGSDGGTIGTPDGDLLLEAGETWWAGGNNNRALEGVAFGNDGYARGDLGVNDGFGVLADDTVIGEDGTDTLYLWNNSGVTVPAGETINFVYFYSSIGGVEQGSRDGAGMTNAEFNAQAAALFGSPATVLANTRLMEGIVGGAYNWGTSPAPALAETGVDASGIAIGGALALVAGAGVYAVRRRRALV